MSQIGVGSSLDPLKTEIVHHQTTMPQLSEISAVVTVTPNDFSFLVLEISYPGAGLRPLKEGPYNPLHIKSSIVRGLWFRAPVRLSRPPHFKVTGIARQGRKSGNTLSIPYSWIPDKPS